MNIQQLFRMDVDTFVKYSKEYLAEAMKDPVATEVNRIKLFFITMIRLRPYKKGAAYLLADLERTVNLLTEDAMRGFDGIR